MENETGIKRFFGLCPQNDSQREYITGNKPTCVALWNDSRCHPEFILESIQLQDK